MRNNKPNQKHRHILATIWLSVILVGNTIAAPIYMMVHPVLKEAMPQAPNIMWRIFGVLAIIVVVCTIALFKYKKWGFWGICILSLISIVPDFMYGAGYGTIIGPCAVLFLYGLLRLGKENSAWNHLK